MHTTLTLPFGEPHHVADFTNLVHIQTLFPLCSISSALVLFIPMALVIIFMLTLKYVPQKT